MILTPICQIKNIPPPENEISQIEKGLKILNLDFEKQVFLNNPWYIL